MSPPTMCPGIIVWCQEFLKIILSNVVKIICEKYSPTCILFINHPPSINLDAEFSEIVRQENCALTFPRSTCLDVYETLVCQRG